MPITSPFDAVGRRARQVSSGGSAYPDAGYQPDADDQAEVMRAQQTSDVQDAARGEQQQVDANAQAALDTEAKQKAADAAAQQKAEENQQRLDTQDAETHARADEQIFKTNGQETVPVVEKGPDGRSFIRQQPTGQYQEADLGTRTFANGKTLQGKRNSDGSEVWTDPLQGSNEGGRASLNVKNGQIIATPKGKGTGDIGAKDVTDQGITDKMDQPAPANAPINDPNVRAQVDTEEQKVLKQASREQVNDTVKVAADKANDDFSTASGAHKDALTALKQAQADAKANGDDPAESPQVQKAAKAELAARQALTATAQKKNDLTRQARDAAADPLGYLQRQHDAANGNGPDDASPVPTTQPGALTPDEQAAKDRGTAEADAEMAAAGITPNSSSAKTAPDTAAPPATTPAAQPGASPSTPSAAMSGDTSAATTPPTAGAPLDASSKEPQGPPSDLAAHPLFLVNPADGSKMPVSMGDPNNPDPTLDNKPTDNDTEYMKQRWNLLHPDDRIHTTNDWQAGGAMIKGTDPTAPQKEIATEAAGSWGQFIKNSAEAIPVGLDIGVGKFIETMGSTMQAPQMLKPYIQDAVNSIMKPVISKDAYQRGLVREANAQPQLFDRIADNVAGIGKDMKDLGENKMKTMPPNMVTNMIEGTAELVPAMASKTLSVPIMGLNGFQSSWDEARANGKSPLGALAAGVIGGLTYAAVGPSTARLPFIRALEADPLAAEGQIYKLLMGGAKKATTVLLADVAKAIPRTALEGLGFNYGGQIAQGNNPAEALVGGTKDQKDQAATGAVQSVGQFLPFALFGSIAKGWSMKKTGDAVDAAVKTVNDARTAASPDAPQIQRHDFIADLLRANTVQRFSAALSTIQAGHNKIDADATMTPEDKMKAKADLLKEVPLDLRPVITRHLDDAISATKQTQDIQAAGEQQLRALPPPLPGFAHFDDPALAAEIADVQDRIRVAQAHEANNPGGMTEDPTQRVGLPAATPEYLAKLQKEQANRAKVVDIQNSTVQAVEKVRTDLQTSLMATHDFAGTPEGRHALDRLNAYNDSLPTGTPKADTSVLRAASDMAPRVHDGPVQPGADHYIPVAHEISQLETPTQQTFASAAVKMVNGRELTQDETQLMQGGVKDPASGETSGPALNDLTGKPMVADGPNGPVLTDDGLDRLKQLVPSADGILPKSEQAAREAPGEPAKPSKSDEEVPDIAPAAPKPEHLKMDPESISNRIEGIKASMAKAKERGASLPPHAEAELASLQGALNHVAHATTPLEVGSEVSFYHHDADKGPGVMTGDVAAVTPTGYQVYGEDGREHTVPFHEAFPPEKETNEAKPAEKAEDVGPEKPSTAPEDAAKDVADALASHAKGEISRVELNDRLRARGMDNEAIEQAIKDHKPTDAAPAKKEPPPLPSIPGVTKAEMAKAPIATRLLPTVLKNWSGVMRALGIDPKDPFEKMTFPDGTIGLGITPGSLGKLQLDIAALEKSMKSGDLPDDETRMARLDAVMEEEMIHLATFKMLKAQGLSDAEANDRLAGEWGKLSPEGRQAVIDQYPYLAYRKEGSPGNDAKEEVKDWQRGAEAIRMMVSLARSGRISELQKMVTPESKPFIQQLLDYLKSVLKPNDKDTKRMVQTIQDMLDVMPDEVDSSTHDGTLSEDAKSKLQVRPTEGQESSLVSPVQGDLHAPLEGAPREGTGLRQEGKGTGQVDVPVQSREAGPAAVQGVRQSENGNASPGLQRPGQGGLALPGAPRDATSNAPIVPRGTNIKVPGGDSIPAQYKVLEMGDVSENPANERDYDQPAEQQKNLGMTQRFDPDYPLADNPDAVHGPPIVRPEPVLDGSGQPLKDAQGNPKMKYTLLGGHRRNRLIGSSYDQYRPAMEQRAPQMDPTANPQAMRRPALYRVVNTPPAEDEKYIRAFNESPTGGIDPANDAVSAGKQITPDIVSDIGTLFQSDPDKTPLAHLTDGDTKALAKSLLDAGAIRQADREKYILPNGNLSPDGARYARNVLLGGIVSDPVLLREIGDTPLATKLLNALTPLYTMKARGLDIAPLVQAVKLEADRAREGIKSVDDHQAQGVLGGAVEPAAEGAKALQQVLGNITSRDSRRVFTQLQGLVVPLEPGQQGLFGESNRASLGDVTPEEARNLVQKSQAVTKAAENLKTVEAARKPNAIDLLKKSVAGWVPDEKLANVSDAALQRKIDFLKARIKKDGENPKLEDQKLLGHLQDQLFYRGQSDRLNNIQGEQDKLVGGRAARTDTETPDMFAPRVTEPVTPAPQADNRPAGEAPDLPREAALKVYRTLTGIRDGGTALSPSQSIALERAERALGQSFIPGMEETGGLKQHEQDRLGFLNDVAKERPLNTEERSDLSKLQKRDTQQNLFDTSREAMQGQQALFGAAADYGKSLRDANGDDRPLDFSKEYQTDNGTKPSPELERAAEETGLFHSPFRLFGASPDPSEGPSVETYRDERPVDGPLAELPSAERARAQLASSFLGIPVAESIRNPIRKMVDNAFPIDSTRNAFATALHNAKDEMLQLFAPATRTREAYIAAKGWSMVAAERRMLKSQAVEATRKAHGFLDGKDFETYNRPLISAIENNTKFSDPAGQAVAEMLRTTNNRFRDMLRNLPNSHFRNYIENYFPHLWAPKDQAAVKAYYQRKMEGSKSFLKHRTVPTVEEGLNHGWSLASDNPVDLFLKRWDDMLAYKQGQDYLAYGKEAGIFKAFKSDADAPFGWTQVDNRIGTSTESVPADRDTPGAYRVQSDAPALPGMVEQPKYMIDRHVSYYAPDSVARVINNHLAPGLSNSALYKGFMMGANSLNQANLGFSAFHVGFVTADSAISAHAMALQHLLDGRPLEAAKMAGIAYTPGLAPIRAYFQGNRLLKAALHPGSDPEMDEMVNSVVRGGGDFKRNEMYSDNWVGSMMKEARRGFNLQGGAIKSLMKGDFVGAERQDADAVRHLIKAGVRIPFAAIEAISHPILGNMVPRVKLGVFMDMARRELHRLGPDAPKQLQLERMQKAWASVDNRLGEVVYDNYHFNQGAKHLMFAAVRSVGWDLGTARELGFGAGDAAKAVGKAVMLKGERDDFSHRLAYLISMPLMVGAFSALWTRLATGKNPQSMTDYAFPPTGEIDPDGHVIRMSPPTYEKDVAGFAHQPGQTLINKLNPIWGNMFQLWQNKDYWGNQIYGPDDNAFQRGAKMLGYEAGAFEPFAVSGYEQNKKQGATGFKKWAPFVGLTPAAKWLSKTAAENRADEIAASHADPAGKTEEQAQHSQAYNKLIADLRASDPKYAKDDADRAARSATHSKVLSDAMHAGVITSSTRGLAIKASRETALERSFQRMQYSEAKSVWHLASPEEKMRLRPEFQKIMLSEKKHGGSPDFRLLGPKPQPETEMAAQ